MNFVSPNNGDLYLLPALILHGSPNSASMEIMTGPDEESCYAVVMVVMDCIILKMHEYPQGKLGNFPTIQLVTQKIQCCQLMFHVPKSIKYALANQCVI